MSDLNDLFNGLQMLQSGIQQYKIGGAISNARTALDQANAQNMKAEDMRKFQQGLANDLSMRMSGLGAPVSQIQQAFSALAPKHFNNLGEMQIEAAVTGNEVLEQQASGLMKAQKLADLEQKKQEAAIENKNRLKEISAQGAEQRANTLLSNQGDINKSLIAASVELNKNDPSKMTTMQRIGKLSGEDKQKIGLLADGYSNLRAMSTALKANQSTYSLFGNKFTINRDSFANTLLRLESGGAITKEEREDIISRLPSKITPEVVKNLKLDTFINSVETRAGIYGFNRNELAFFGDPKRREQLLSGKVPDPLPENLSWKGLTESKGNGKSPILSNIRKK